MAAEMLSTQQVAALLGVSDRRARQINNEDNPPPKVGDGRYPCDQFGQWLRQRIIGEIGVSATGEVYDYDAEKARLTYHQANISALDEEVKRKNLIPADVVQAHWEGMVANTRAKLLNLPGRLAVLSAGSGNIQDAERAARELIYEALNELVGNGIP